MTLYPKKSQAIGLFFLCAIFVAIGIWMGVTGEWIGYLIAGERVRPLRRFSGGARIAIAIGVLLLLVNVVMVLITNITN